MKKLCVIAVVMLAAPAAAEAQNCAGAPSFGQAPFQVGVATAFQDGARGVGGTFAAGGESVFAGAQLSMLSFSNVDAHQTNIAAFGGADVAVDPDRRLFVCPAALVGFGSGPDVGTADISTIDFRGGGRVGLIAHDTDQIMVVPSFGLSLGWQRMKASLSGQTATDSETFGVASLGVGFVFNRRIGIVPSISIPFSAPQSDVTFTLGMAYNFGR
jgi:hypothetical protein